MKNIRIKKRNPREKTSTLLGVFFLVGYFVIFVLLLWAEFFRANPRVYIASRLIFSVHSTICLPYTPPATFICQRRISTFLSLCMYQLWHSNLRESVCVSVFLFVCISVCLYFCVSVCLSFCVSVWL